MEKGVLPALFRLRKTQHRKYRGHFFKKGFRTRAGSVADEVLCSRLGGTGDPRVDAAGGRGKMLSHWGAIGAVPASVRGKGRDVLCVPAGTALALCV